MDRICTIMSFRYFYLRSFFFVFGGILFFPFSSTWSYESGRVNNRTLNFFLNTTHLELPCYVPIQIQAAYNSYSGKESIFREKWTFNHNIRIKAVGTKFIVLEGDGFENEYTRERTLEEATQNLVEQILILV